MFKNTLVLGVIGVLVLLASTGAVKAQPGPNDVQVKWDDGFPKTENGKLKCQGTTVFNNNWRSADGKV